MTDLIKTNVLIVGNGPSGMTTALTLAKFGVASTIIEKRPSLYMEPRAHALNSRTLEIFSALGINLEEFKALATPLEESNWVRWVDKLNGSEYGKLPYERMVDEGDLPSPHPLFNISQPNCERVLQKHINQESLITTLRPYDWLGCEQVEAGVISQVKNEKGEVFDILSRFLIGADGAGSPVRRSQNIGMTGMGIVQNFSMIHFKADLSSIVKDKPAILYWLMSQDCMGTLIAYDIRDNWVFMYPYNDAEMDKSIFTPEYCQQLVHSAIGQNDIEVELLNCSHWGLGSQIADRYRSKNVFLVGDSAHRYPPSGGLGLNTGVGDAQNIAWKIAAVLKQWGWSDLLDSYEKERKQVAQHNADFSVNNAGKLFSIMLATQSLMPKDKQTSITELRANPEKWAEIQQGIEDQRDHFDGMALHIGQHYGRKQAPDLRADNLQFSDIGARFPHTWITIHDQPSSSLDLLSAQHFTLITKVAVDPNQISTQVPLKIKVENNHFKADQNSLKVMGLNDVSAVLIRPDGHICARLSEQQITESVIIEALHNATANLAEFV